MTRSLSKTARIAGDQDLINGINAQLKGASLTVANQVVTASQAVATLQARIDATNAVTTAKAAWQTAVKTEDTELAQTKLFVAALRKAVSIMFAGATSTLADFGIAPPKPRTALTAAQKLLAAQRAQATRVARHTVGPKAKLAIKGTVNTVSETQAPTVQAPKA